MIPSRYMSARSSRHADCQTGGVAPFADRDQTRYSLLKDIEDQDTPGYNKELTTAMVGCLANIDDTARADDMLMGRYSEYR